jgi:hypothetical protein
MRDLLRRVAYPRLPGDVDPLEEQRFGKPADGAPPASAQSGAPRRGAPLLVRFC